MDCRITRIANACVLIEIAGVAILTDPWFQNSRFFSEHATMSPADLPQLDVVLGGHWANDHWDIGALSELSGSPTRVRVCDRSLVRSSRRAGFDDVQVMKWGRSERVRDVRIQAVREHRALGKFSNNYLITSSTHRVFVATECLDLEALRSFRASEGPCDVVLGPVNGVRMFGRPLVMTADQMLEAVRILGASTFVPIHDSHKPIWGVVRISSSGADLDRLDTTGLNVVRLRPSEAFLA